ncbi:MAG: nuclear transport factor 2 family protein [Deltaproteobacteria bacterium]|nr:nuclear transport factor 2 family protein [Deltaproteobacteria bacterium]MBW2362263.1 nuclear transport factor 2 family protein [Deltaproteobacteria bacterium]
MSDADDRFAIIAALDRYAECLDTRDWAGLSDVFADDIDLDFGVWRASDLEGVRSNIRRFLDPCGPSQHLLGNYRIELDGDRATSRCYCRVMHFGRDEHAGKTYEAWLEYADEWTRTALGWRSVRRIAHTSMQQGDPSLLGSSNR